ncbi:MAG: hypothetical protein AAF563_05215 [Pseudomonadota bacterium]
MYYYYLSPAEWLDFFVTTLICVGVVCVIGALAPAMFENNVQSRYVTMDARNHRIWRWIRLCALFGGVALIIGGTLAQLFWLDGT